MKKEELKGSMKPFVYECLFNEEAESFDKIVAYTEKAESVEEFKSLIFGDKSLRLSQGFAELCKEADDYYERVEKFLGENIRRTYSDAGSLKLGNSSFSILIPNGYGDGVTQYAVLGEKEWNDNLLKFLTQVEGKFNIFSYDCGNEVQETVRGKFNIFSGAGIVVFQRTK